MTCFLPTTADIQNEILELRTDLIKTISDINQLIGLNRVSVRSPEYLVLKEHYYQLKHRIRYLQNELNDNRGRALL